jgi:hypothetical protein
MLFQDNPIPSEILQFLQGQVTMCHTLPQLVENNQVSAASHPRDSQIIEKY